MIATQICGNAKEYIIHDISFKQRHLFWGGPQIRERVGTFGQGGETQRLVAVCTSGRWWDVEKKLLVMKGTVIVSSPSSAGTPISQAYSEIENIGS